MGMGLLAHVALLELSVEVVAVGPVGRVQVLAHGDYCRAGHILIIPLFRQNDRLICVLLPGLPPYRCLCYQIGAGESNRMTKRAETKDERSRDVAETIFDLVVMGGGPAGYTCAIRAAQYGLKVALIEKTDKLGGTCLHWGCIPTKSMLFSAEIWDHLKHADRYGIEVKNPQLNWKGVLARKNDVITKHTKGLEFLMKKNKITTFQGYGRLTGPAKDGVHAIEVDRDGKKETVKAKKVALATGSDARMLPGYKPDNTILTNMEILTIDRVPASLIVIGSGAVGVEFASVFNSFGTQVTIIEALPRVVPVEDEDVSKELLRAYKKRGIDVHVSAKVDKIEKTADGVNVHFTKSDGKGEIKAAEKVLVAVGRAPRTTDIGIEKTGIKLDRAL